MSRAPLVIRALLAGPFIHGGWAQVGGADALAHQAEPIAEALNASAGPTAQALLGREVTGRDLVLLNGGAMMVGGAALVTGVGVRCAAGGLILSLLPTTAQGHAFWKEEGAKRSQKLQGALTNGALVAGLALLALRGSRRRR
ncbi:MULTISPECIES: DoxX family membrane protein [Actinomyces]|uniref:DoxX family membrane protein n=1 Tax=Actinomyces marmotae TaxID=2737173 RepID=A0A6M8B725_9ACTO|nr:MULTISPECIES: DoxX family membrane protein [Actinomyces]QKD79043.1 DoxX family membrane protein [Actinomyces marmotae]